MAYLEDGASASGSVDLGLDYELRQINDLKIGVHSFPALTFNIKRDKQAGKLTRRAVENGTLPHLSLVDEWPATPKRARKVPRRFLMPGR